MASSRPFDYGDRDYIDNLNDLFNTGVPKIRADSADPESAGVDISADRQLVFDDNGTIADVTGSCTLTFNVSTLQDGWGMFVHVLTGTATINVSTSGALFRDGASSKTITAGNSAFISSDGVGYRIFRMPSA